MRPFARKTAAATAEPPASPTSDELRAEQRALLDQITDLGRRRKAVIDEIVAIEKSGDAMPERPQPAPDLGEGFEDLAPPAARTTGEQLWILGERRRLIDERLERVRIKLQVTSGHLYRATVAERADEIQALVRRRVLAVATLRNANREWARLAADLTALGTGMPADLPLNYQHGPLGLWDNAGPLYEFLQEAVRQGVVTKEELDHA